MTIAETERLVIRTYTPDDIDSLVKILSNPITMQFWPAPFTRDQARAWMNRNFKSYREFGFGRWAITRKDTGALIGDCGILRAPIDGTVENDLGYIVDYRHWNHGYAIEAAMACMNYGFEIAHLNRLCANMATDHVRSQNVAIKLGMKREKLFYNPRNRNLPTYLYAIVR